MSESLDDQMARLQKARNEVDRLSREQSRLQGNIDRQKQLMEELEAKCQKDFGCSIDELPDMIENLREEAEKKLKEAEDILDGKTSVAPVKSPPTQKKASAKSVDKDDDLDKDVDHDSLF